MEDAVLTTITNLNFGQNCKDVKIKKKHLINILILCAYYTISFCLTKICKPDELWKLNKTCTLFSLKLNEKRSQLLKLSTIVCKKPKLKLKNKFTSYVDLSKKKNLKKPFLIEKNKS